MSLWTINDAVLLISKNTKISQLFNMQTLIKLIIRPEMNKTFVRRNVFVLMKISAFSLFSTRIRWPFAVSMTSLPSVVKVTKTFQSFEQWQPASESKFQTVPHMKMNKLGTITWMIVQKKMMTSGSKSTRPTKISDAGLGNLNDWLSLFLMLLVV